MKFALFFSLALVALFATFFQPSSQAPTSHNVGRSPGPPAPMYLSRITDPFNGTEPLAPRADTICYKETAQDRIRDAQDANIDAALAKLPGFDDELRKIKRQISGFACSNGPNPQPGTGAPMGNLVSYSVDQALQAGNYALYLLENGLRIYTRATGRRSKFPKRFQNRESIASLIVQCPGLDLWEYPILESHHIYAGSAPDYVGGPPGADRIIFSACPARLCGVITHRGRRNNGFQDCPSVA